ncbi:PHP domain-containing protein [Candidatus Formimonas warabiya]|uniref:Polymerase/histidinol phosphatase N-terminal domain-containing protein n=1 Tax=Formimonas warabiya TaxID=1761012 RepID=A0A3G1KLY4_FORW1|nr:PHP domain-containing protein [Candidatus Formimonas warabiya]ATW23442.1 hypothetical protein DCMF_00305 [Candidatus Formimonas warabiya]
MFADLHTHSFYSDGTNSPQEIISLAKARGIRALSLVDHDTVQGIPDFLSAGEKQGVEVIPGLEISTSIQGKRIHILGYHIDCENPFLAEFLSHISRARTENTRMILDKLNQMNWLDYPWERVRELNLGRAWVHSSHVFRAMMQDGFYADWDQWMDFYYRYFGKSSPAYLDIEGFTPENAIDVIIKAQGIPVLAHPKLIGDDEQIRPLVEHGLKGIEVFYPAHDAADVIKYGEMAGKYGLVITGGTDWHGKGTEWKVNLGDCGIDAALFTRLKTFRLQEEKTSEKGKGKKGSSC